MEPLLIGKYSTGVQKNVKPFMTSEEAFPNLLNCFVFRERVQRKSGYDLLGRLRRELSSVSLGNVDSTSPPLDLFTLLGLNATEPNATIEPGNITPIVITFAAPIGQTITEDDGSGTFSTITPGIITAAAINYKTGVVTLTFSGAAAASATTITAAYYPNLPVMGIRERKVTNQINQNATVFFDTRYAYQFAGGFFSELPSTLTTTWNCNEPSLPGVTGDGLHLFWSTNFQTNPLSQDYFWATNNKSGLHQYTVTDFSGQANPSPGVYTVDVTSAGNTFQVGDFIYFVNAKTSSTTFSLNNLLSGTVTAAGNPFTITGSQLYTNEAGLVSGMAVSPNRNVSGDGVRLYDGTTWSNFNPATNAINVVTAALITLPYKGRMLFFNTEEGNSAGPLTRFPNRVRWSQLSIDGTATDYNHAWLDSVVGRGGYEDAPTSEAIVSAGIIKDNMVVYFENSTWILVYSGNEIGPFFWQKVNSELGCESTFSNTLFDNGIIALGNVGIHTSNGTVTERIDAIIPDEIFNIHTSVDGPLRSYAVRDFFQEIVYFSYANNLDNTAGSATKTFYPNQMLIYNYRNNTFSFFDDAATCFGCFQRTIGKTWAQLNKNSDRWEAWNTPWNSGVLQAGFPSICFGNQQGFVEIIQPFSSASDDSLFIADISGGVITSPQHGLFTDQYIYISGCQGVTGINGNVFKINQVIDADTFSIDGVETGTYTGLGTISVVSNVLILTKQFTPNWQQAQCYVIKQIEMLFDSTTQGELQVDTFINFSNISSLSSNNTSMLGLPIIATYPEGSFPPFPSPSPPLPYYSFQTQQAQIWKRFYTDATGETFQVQLSYNDDQMRNLSIAESNLVLHAMIFHFDPAGDFY